MEKTQGKEEMIIPKEGITIGHDKWEDMSVAQNWELPVPLL